MGPPVAPDEDAPALNPSGAGSLYFVEETAHLVAEQSVFDPFASTASHRRQDNDPTAAGSCP